MGTITETNKKSFYKRHPKHVKIVFKCKYVNTNTLFSIKFPKHMEENGVLYKK